MNINSFWRLGETVALRGVWHGQLWYAGPAYVVADLQDLTAVYWPAGTVCKNYGGHVSAQMWAAGPKGPLVDHVWRENDVLSLSTPGEGHSIWAMWEAGTRNLRCWYVNLEEPQRRTKLGFDSMDFELDIVIQPDKSSWRWKDEDLFDELVGVGVFSETEAKAIRAEGLGVVEKLRGNRSPFCDDWENWRPPADWTIPVLPPGWDKVGE
jgi:hypothetical protein